MNAYNRRGQIGSFLDRGFKALWDSPEKERFFDRFHASAYPACMYNPKKRLMNSALDGGELQNPTGPFPEHAEFV